MFGYEPRSKGYDDESDGGTDQFTWTWSNILLLPFVPILLFFFVYLIPFLPFFAYFLKDVYSTLKNTVNTGQLSHPFLANAGLWLAVILVIANFNRPENTPIQFSFLLILAIGYIVIFTILPFLALCLHLPVIFYSFIRAKLSDIKPRRLFFASMGILFSLMLFWGFSNYSTLIPKPEPIPTPASIPAALPADIPDEKHSIRILVDDFSPQPYQGESMYFFNRLDGDRGAISDSVIDWGRGQVTTTVAPGSSWAGVWMSLNHPIREGLAIDLSAILPSQILPAYQAQITAITVQVARGTPDAVFRLELKNGNELLWKEEVRLEGSEQTLSFDLPTQGRINHLAWVLDQAAPGDYVVLDNISFTVSTPVTDTATAAFVWSYGMLLNNWDPVSGLVRDKAKDASGEFEAIQATGCLAAATAIAEQRGIIEHATAVQIINQISHTLLLDLPRLHGLWPHWVKTSPTGEISIVENTEWSSVDTVIAAVGLLSAQSSLGMYTSNTEQMLREIDWQNLVRPEGIAHGYTNSGALIPYAWDVFGGESWLVELVYAGAMEQVATITYPTPPTANGSGFIDELAWLFVAPPTQPDYWGTDWNAYRSRAAENQTHYYLTHFPQSCFAQAGWFGLSAAEVPFPSFVPPSDIYQAFGAGGRFAAPNDGTARLGTPVIVPHYPAMIASIRPQAAIAMWDGLIRRGYFSPLNNVESLMFSSVENCDDSSVVWNSLKGSWNLSLQTLGWGRYLAERDGKIPVLWQAQTANPLLKKGYRLLAPNEPAPIAVYIPHPNETATTILWDHTQVSCDGKPNNMWCSPGNYLYQRNNGGSFSTITLQPGQACPKLGVSGPDTLSARGTENVTTGLGTFPSTRLSAGRDYSILTGRLDYVKGKYERSEWYVCGYGLVKLTSSDAGISMPANKPYSNSENLILMSFTPLTTNESHVRYILADIQLGHIVDDYRADVADEETAEALRRWDAGVRVKNITRFERRIVNGQWQIVYTGTVNPVDGMDVDTW